MDVRGIVSGGVIVYDLIISSSFVLLGLFRTRLFPNMMSLGPTLIEDDLVVLATIQ